MIKPKIKRIAGFFFLIFLQSCVSPSYQNTTYDIEEFAADSLLIAEGRGAIEELESAPIEEEPDECKMKETIDEEDSLSFLLILPPKMPQWQNLKAIQERLSFKIREGSALFPLLGPVFLKELTLKEAKKELEARYQEIFPSATVYLEFINKKARRVQVIGGNVPFVQITNETRLNEILAFAGIRPETNLFKSYLLRNERKINVDFYKLVHEGDECENILVQDGDSLFLAPKEETTVLVAGEVFTPLSLPIPSGKISLKEALAAARGALFTASKSHIYVIRSKMQRPKIYCISWEEILQRRDKELYLMDGDILYLTERPITKWNRFMSQLLPAFSCLEITAPFKVLVVEQEPL